MSESGADKVGLRLSNAALNYAPSQPEPQQQQIDPFTPQPEQVPSNPAQIPMNDPASEQSFLWAMIRHRIRHSLSRPNRISLGMTRPQ